MDFGRRHWAAALLAAALLQLALAAALYRPHSGRISGTQGGVEIQIGSSLTGIAGTEDPKTAPEGGMASLSPSAIRAQTKATSAPEPAFAGAASLPEKNEFKAVTLPAPATESAPAPAITPLAAARTLLQPAVQTGASPPEQEWRSDRTANIAAPAQAGSAKSKAGGKQSNQTAALTTSNKTDQAGGRNASTAAGTGGSTHVTTTVSPDYYRKLAAWLEQHKRYPRRAIQRRQQGVVRVAFKIDRNGNLLSREIVGSSGYRLLDEAADSLLQRASPMPGIPHHSTAQVLEVIVPIRFALR